MPYIKDNRKDPVLNQVKILDTSGDLTYAITAICLTWLESNNKVNSFENLSNIIKALECAKLEFYRRVMVPYENNKLSENSDVYITFDFPNTHWGE